MKSNILEIGLKYTTKRIDVRSEGHHTTILDTGTCIYIHPELRFILLLFPCGIRECFRLSEVTPYGT